MNAAKSKKGKRQVIHSSFGNLVSALYDSVPRKIRDTPQGTTLVMLALYDLRSQGMKIEL